MGDGFGWLEVERIGEELCDAHPEIGPFSVTFPRLRELVEALDGFEGDPAHNVNERILEAIQQAWHSEREDVPRDDEP